MRLADDRMGQLRRLIDANRLLSAVAAGALACGLAGFAIQLSLNSRAVSRPNGLAAHHAGPRGEPLTEADAAMAANPPVPLFVYYLPVLLLGAFCVGLGLAAGFAGGFWLARRSPAASRRTTTASRPSSSPPAPSAAQAVPGQAPPAAPAKKVFSASLVGKRYRLGRNIGQGGMGEVFEAYDEQIKRVVAVKKMRAELKDFPEDRDRFLREARIVGQLSHPYIVPIHEVIEEDKDIYLVLDFVQGKTLSQVLNERGRLPLADTIRLFGYVCEAIECAHGAKVLHRDLKPSNIMVEDRGYAKVMDFGIARQAKETITRLTQVDDSGTPAYMAPESHMGRANRASDVYALGVCLYETLTGQLPFRGPDFFAQKERMKFAPPQFLVPELPAQVELLMQAALAADPKDRVASAAELREVLQGLAPQQQPS